MKASLTLTYFLAAIGSSAYAFQHRNKILRQVVPSSTSSLYAETTVSNDPSEEATTSGVKSLGLLTFDLDDTLYPISTVVADANGMFLLSFGASRATITRSLLTTQWRWWRMLQLPINTTSHRPDIHFSFSL